MKNVEFFTTFFLKKRITQLFKKYLMKKLIIIIFISLFVGNIMGEVLEKKITISGYIRDISNGEELIGATVFVKELKSGTATNVYGFYSISVSPAEYTFVYSYIGYKSIEKKISLEEDLTLNIELKTDDKLLKEVLIQGEKKTREH